MLWLKAAPALARPGASATFKWLLSSRSLRTTGAHNGGQRGDVSSSARPGRRGGGGDGTATTAASHEISVDFELTREAYKSKDSLELLRSLVVFKLCSYSILVDKNKEIMDLGKAILGRRAFDQLMKMTFYGQFVAGEDHRAIRPLIQKNVAFGVGSVLDYSVEEDISQEEPEPRERSDSSVSMAEKGGIGGDHGEEKHKVHKQLGERRGGASGGAPTYSNSNEAKCDQHMETFIKCIKASGGSSMDGFSAIKMTALGRPQFLLQFSEVLVKWQRFFTFLASKQGKDGTGTSEQRLELDQLQEFLTRAGAKGNFYGWFTGREEAASGTIDALDWNSLIDDRAETSDLLVVPNQGELGPLLEKFTTEEEEQMKRMLQRMDILAKHALENGVRLMVDAEQTYFQPAISKLTLEMQRLHNRQTPVIFNTYQCYLKEAYEQVAMDVELSRREGWHFAAKLVRGAYMYQERERAEELGYEDPINPDYESTNRMYHRCLDYVLDEIALNRNANVMVASHNEDTVKHTLRRMNELGLTPTENKVYFGQLLGMCDQISFPLGQAGYPVYKYVPYGPVNEVMPYLSRRAQENRGFMKGAQKERELLWRELKRRLASGELLYRPVY
ncbi:proline dehydrogenase 1, mitochondrial isoform X1 [Scophthalmus maximus]|uniref:proline dehydrogenase 1, mitochondrial isoform X1 n=2 Tax=Scophthalmus maximus TaxID=52904 RepID=UPI001FA834F9|nr:proline dehydrogenase 1, mitochondrial isoform X1 [Scophthalmus maximus]